MIPKTIWNDQATFNAELRSLPTTEPAIRVFIRDMALNLISEVDELLRTTSWKSHRRQPHRPNREHRLEELTDIFKLWLTVAQGLGYTDEELEEAYWRKSMVCRQRHSEEWLTHGDKPTWVLDIDNVLADYTTGFCQWLQQRAPVFAEAAQNVLDRRTFFTSGSDFGMTAAEWQGFKHEFRSGGHKANLPPMPGARDFTWRLRDNGYRIVLLTSRPIDRYPNIFSNTLWWLQKNGIAFDWVWWAADKGERLIEAALTKHVVGVVDDDPKYVAQFAKLGLQTYWLQSTDHTPSHPFYTSAATVHRVQSLEAIPVTPVTSAPRRVNFGEDER